MKGEPKSIMHKLSRFVFSSCIVHKIFPPESRGKRLFGSQSKSKATSQQTPVSVLAAAIFSKVTWYLKWDLVLMWMHRFQIVKLKKIGSLPYYIVWIGTKEKIRTFSLVTFLDQLDIKNILSKVETYTTIISAVVTGVSRCPQAWEKFLQGSVWAWQTEIARTLYINLCFSLNHES